MDPRRHRDPKGLLQQWGAGGLGAPPGFWGASGWAGVSRRLISGSLVHVFVFSCSVVWRSAAPAAEDTKPAQDPLLNVGEFISCTAQPMHLATSFLLLFLCLVKQKQTLGQNPLCQEPRARPHGVCPPVPRVEFLQEFASRKTRGRWWQVPSWHPSLQCPHVPYCL